MPTSATMAELAPPAPMLVPGSPPGAAPRGSMRDARTLSDLMVDGFYMLFLLKNRFVPSGAQELRGRVRDFLAQVERAAKRLELSAEDVYLAKYAYCALVDETILTSQSAVRDAWERKPLQLELFGDQLAGENFFVRLDELRQQGARRLAVLEVFHLCLLLGFQGRFMIEGSEKLGYLTDRLGDEIARHKGRRAPFAPHGAPPDTLLHRLRGEVPLWAMASMFALAGLLAFTGLRWSLGQQTERDLGAYSQLVKMPPEVAHITITLP